MNAKTSMIETLTALKQPTKRYQPHALDPDDPGRPEADFSIFNREMDAMFQAAMEKAIARGHERKPPPPPEETFEAHYVPPLRLESA